MELWRLRKHYLSNAICHKCKASKQPGQFQKQLLDWSCFLVPKKFVYWIYVFLMRGENVESQLNIIYRKILLVRSWLWGIQTFGTSTTLLALLWHNSIPNAFILYVHWLWWSGSDRPLSDCAICTLFTSVFVSGWMAVGCTCSLTMATWAHQGLHSKSIWTCSIGDSIRGAQCPA